MLSAAKGLERLREGNRRFVTSRTGDGAQPRPIRRAELTMDQVRPSVEGLLQTELRHDPDALVSHAVRHNVAISVSHLRHGSEVLEELIETDGLRIVGAEYSLETGVVEFFDGAQVGVR